MHKAVASLSVLQCCSSGATRTREDHDEEDDGHHDGVRRELLPQALRTCEQAAGGCRRQQAAAAALQQLALAGWITDDQQSETCRRRASQRQRPGRNFERQTRRMEAGRRCCTRITLLVPSSSCEAPRSPTRSRPPSSCRPACRSARSSLLSRAWRPPAAAECGGARSGAGQRKRQRSQPRPLRRALTMAAACCWWSPRVSARRKARRSALLLSPPRQAAHLRPACAQGQRRCPTLENFQPACPSGGRV